MENNEKITPDNLSFLSVCSPEKDCWLSFLAYRSKENYSAGWRG